MALILLTLPSPFPSFLPFCFHFAPEIYVFHLRRFYKTSFLLQTVQILLSIPLFFLSFCFFFPLVVIFAIFQFLCSFLCHFHLQCVGKMTSSRTHYDTRLCMQGIETYAKSRICWWMCLCVWLRAQIYRSFLQVWSSTIIVSHKCSWRYVDIIIQI